MVIMQDDARGIRRQQGLPTLESNADARFGVDGGRHAQVLLQLNKAGATPHNWLLVSLLKNYTVQLQVHTPQGMVVYLEKNNHQEGYGTGHILVITTIHTATKLNNITQTQQNLTTLCKLCKMYKT